MAQGKSPRNRASRRAEGEASERAEGEASESGVRVRAK